MTCSWLDYCSLTHTFPTVHPFWMLHDEGCEAQLQLIPLSSVCLSVSGRWKGRVIMKEVRLYTCLCVRHKIPGMRQTNISCLHYQLCVTYNNFSVFRSVTFISWDNTWKIFELLHNTYWNQLEVVHSLAFDRAVGSRYKKHCSWEKNSFPAMKKKKL